MALSPLGDFFVIEGRSGPKGETWQIKVFDGDGHQNKTGRIPAIQTTNSGWIQVDPTGKFLTVFESTQAYNDADQNLTTM